MTPVDIVKLAREAAHAAFDAHGAGWPGAAIAGSTRSMCTAGSRATVGSAFCIASSGIVRGRWRSG